MGRSSVSLFSVRAIALCAVRFVAAGTFCFGVSHATALADPNPCTVTPSGSSWIVSCTSFPPTPISPINQNLNGTNGSGGNNGYVFCPPSCPSGGGNGTNGTPTVQTFPTLPGSQAILFPSAPAGIFISSNGGNGGQGGSAYFCGICFGAGGGNGGAGGDQYITVNPNLAITTNAFGVAGVWLQSAGGVGGNGGSGYISIAAGSGGLGGAAGNLTLNAYNAVTTVGDESFGLFVQSIGGGGGMGGGGINFGGGSGGTAMAGGNATVQLGNPGGGGPGVIATYGAESVGILAESIGGFGGSGGGSTVGLFSFSASGASGGNGGSVNVFTTSDSSITTQGQGATGIVAVSSGGGGGYGGGSGSLLFTLAGSGSAGGSGGDVFVDSGATIVTNGAAAKGIFAQSIGGGGGDGGSSASLLGSLGGAGSTTSPGGNVTVINTGTITTNSNVDLSSTAEFGTQAIFAESVGGGGGNGGSTFGLFSIGGSGGGGGNGGVVAVGNTGSLTTFASDSGAIYALSLGGGGGNGGGAVGTGPVFSEAIGGDAGMGGNGEDTSVSSSQGLIVTLGDRSSGIAAQSLGGGGGNGGFAISASGGPVSASIGIGGTGGGGGLGGTVEVNNGDPTMNLFGSNISTSGAQSYGILAQSVGGGGGNGGFSISASGGIASLGLSFGGTSGGGGSANTVTVTNNATIQTIGNGSAGIVAQSIGGGGGNGGFSVAGSGGAVSGSLSFGGSAQGGGNGGIVNLTNGGSIFTEGSDANGLFAQSVGGGGGNGGASVAAGGGFYASFGMAMGGNGGTGGSGNDVTLVNSGSILTMGDRSMGVVAQSVGGGGGNGGLAIDGNFAVGVSGGVTIGGNGSTGGTGGNVMATNAGGITTAGNDADALFVQTVGGGGGNGGFAVSGGLAGIASLQLGIGGSGGSGGSAGNATAINGTKSANSNINTYGAQSSGIVVQSVGGGGGNGGFSVAAGLAEGASLNLGFGGSGGGGASSGTVMLTNFGNITTGLGTNGGDFSDGILAQSMGGGGGNGGFSVAGGLAEGVSANLGLGGQAGSGGFAGSVTVDTTGTIMTNGEHAVGILAQSVGGGGGNGGFAVTGGLGGLASIGVALGGSGGGGGSAGNVYVGNVGGIQTLGNDSDAISAQAVGGGGGSGGFAVAGGLAGAVAANLSLGGSGGSGASAGTVTLTSSAGVGTKCNPVGEQCTPTIGTIITAGDRSDGESAQSIGGNGGNGGFSIAAGGALGASLSLAIGGGGGNGGTSGFVDVQSYDNITTGALATMGGPSGDSADGIFAQSMGGSGGEGGFDIAGGVSEYFSGSVGVGGSGGNGGQAGGVSVLSNGTISTNGNHASDIFAQSVGGAGGDGGFTITGSLSEGPAVGFSVGGSGGAGASSGTVGVTNNGALTSLGNDAYGIFAQSVGGSGGNAGFSVAGGLSESVAIDFSIGGFGGDGGSGGAVSVYNGTATTGSSITTSGERSGGIFAQSIGGSGGNGGFSVAGGIAQGPSLQMSIGGFGGSGAVANTVYVQNYGNIATGIGGGGDGANGILAQSIGGNGGNGGFSVAAGLSTSVGASISIGGFGEAGANAGNVTVNQGDLGSAVFGGTITTNGNGANGIVAESLGGGGGNGGFSIGASLSQGPGIDFSLGGFGGDGGSGGTVTVNNFGNIGTAGQFSAGILALSLGGGGGTGGFSVGGAMTLAPAAALSIGGFGGSGATASDVSVTSIGAIGTGGNNSGAIVAQSIGGSGGDAGWSVSGTLSNNAAVALSVGGFGGSGASGGNVTVDVLNPFTGIKSPTIFTLGNNSDGIEAQSTGGGGGNGGFSVAGVINNGFGLSASLGGFGGSGSTSGTVQVFNTATIYTQGMESNGIEAQSIGGAGGNGGFSIGGTISNSNSLALSMGGFAGGGGNAGIVIVHNYGESIVTLGSQSAGLLAQSIGGNGGNGGFSIAGDIGNSNGAALDLGGFGGGGGNGSRVSVTSGLAVLPNFIGTSGDQSDAIEAQSIGGNGGSGGWTVEGAINNGKGLSIGMGGFGGGGGNADGVSVNANTLVLTTGDQSSGIVAQSIGGGGGNGGWSIDGEVSANASATLALGGNGGIAGNGSVVNLTSTQDVVTKGNNADALLAQSIGGGGGNGGFSIAGAFANSSFQLADSFGGNGGAAGSGGDVTVNSGAKGAPVVITTYGAASSGIFAQSLGGGGGNGGFTINASATGDGDGQPDAAKIGMAAFNIGYGTCTVCPGSGGGDANNAGNVTVTSFSRITTNGDNAGDIVAESTGGGGGNGAWTIGATFDKTGGSAQMMFGAGGGGGNGGNVTVTSTDTLVSNGANSSGILAQSVGGGGGFGGLSATNGFITDIPGLSGIDLGQHGDQGGNSGDVTVTSDSSILTKGANSDGINATSVGGGGGTGGWSIQVGLSTESGIANSILNYAFGSNGGAGGSAGNVSVTSTALAIETRGDDSDGILASSTGGGGGNGGFAINGAITPGWAIGFSMGGQGGSSGNAGTVTVDNSTVIATKGDLSGGIVAVSTGGGGGSGGFAIEALGTTGLTGDSAIGGFSTTGSNGNTVRVTNSGSIGTLGEGADAIFAESVGGGGGSGGFAIAFAATTNRSATFSLGGAGSVGGNGGEVTVDNSAFTLTTVGDNSAGMVAESLGGGGGNGGFSIAGGLSGKGSVNLSIGGSAKTGGNGGGVVAISGMPATITTISTQGNFSDGFLAESLGGGGGNGGFSIAGGVSGGLGFNLGFGGNGGAGGTGGTVYAANDSSITTAGVASNAMEAMSLGGGGGNGGFAIAATLSGSNSVASGTMSLGGSGGTGGDGGFVSAMNDGLLLGTAGAFSDGILAESVGGGGGNGGFSIAGTGSLGSRNLVLGFGGSGGNGGTSDGVSVTSGALGSPTLILTSGAFSDGIQALSVGGGGGNGGFSVEGLATTGSQSFGFNSGGSGGTGNDGGAATVTNFSLIGTSGDNANGIDAASIGGGGGSGGFKLSVSVSTDSSGFSASSSFGFGSGGGGGNGSTVRIGNAGGIVTTGLNSSGILAQSVGGGGGYGGFSYATQLLGDLGIGMGATTDGGGNGGNVTVVNIGPIETLNDNSGAIVAQTVGGGGGEAGFSISGALSTSTSSPLSGINLGLGSNGGMGGNGGNATVTSLSGLLFTKGSNSDGILAQSIGAGGGAGGFAIAADVASSSWGVGLSLGGAGGSAGSGGTVTITNHSNILTEGALSDGILGQSFGGGGGNAGFAVNVLSTQGFSGNVAIGGAGGSGGSGGNVTITSQKGAIVTKGLAAFGIVAQSGGGGGGDGGLGVGGPIPGIPLIGMGVGGNDGGGGSGGNVTVVSDSLIGTSGDFASDLVAQTVGGGGGIGSTDIASPGATLQLNGIINVGATGGFGGSGGMADLGNITRVVSEGFDASALVAQTVGGGGGIAGFETNANATATATSGLFLGATSVGCRNGNGGKGTNSDQQQCGGGFAGNGGAVIVANLGAIGVAGDASDAILAQSIGAGGGDGALDVGGTYSAPALSLHEGAAFSFGDSSSVAVLNGKNGALMTMGFHDDGIQAQSIADGGGNATIEIGGALPGGTTMSFTLGAAGNGTQQSFGGDSGAVTVTNSGAILTDGNFSSAIEGQSIAGGGGDGAYELGGAVAAGGVGAVSIIGGVGTDFATAGAVTITNHASLGTMENDSYGIIAQSIAGGGGNGGFGGTLNDTLNDSTIAGYVIGGIDVTGSTAGKVLVTNTGEIATLGYDDSGILAESLGGGGGNAGYGLTLALGTSGATTLTIVDGGGAGAGNGGGLAEIVDSASVLTEGANSSGLAALSVGGGGGDGGFAANGTLTTATAVSPNQLNVQTGGRGGLLNNGGLAGVANELATIGTMGDESVGIAAQSIGLGGGNAEISFTGAFSGGTPNVALVNVGGYGAAAGSGNGGAAIVASNGLVMTGTTGTAGTTGEFSGGILAQSIGAGGGTGLLNAGLGVPTGTTAATTGAFNVNVGGVGGFNPNGLPGQEGTGGNVFVFDTGSVQTLGANSDAIEAQTVGGGGGNGAANVYGTSTLTSGETAATFDLNVTVGGGGGYENNGGNVTVSQKTGTIVTMGNDSDGILAQTIGGGGGFGGSLNSIVENPADCSSSSSTCSAQMIGANVAIGGHGLGFSNGGSATVTNASTIATGGLDASAIVAQSIGAGGGIGGDAHGAGGNLQNWSIAVGGSNDSEGNGGNVTVTDSAALTTMGNGSSGIIAQTIGGGGGIGGLGLSAPTTVGGTITLGGTGNAGGNGGNVDVTINSPSPGTPTMIATNGNGAFGILAQSVGGGGGIAGDVDGGVSTTVIGSGSSLTSTTSGGGNGGTVNVLDNGNIETNGSGSDGIFAQSIGGGGGLTTGYAGSAGAIGSGGAVTVTQDGIIATTGAGATAIFAQSAGGATGTGGNVTITVNGEALAYGANADGITAQSLGGAGNGDINITIDAGSTVQGGSGSGSVGVRILGGSLNTLLNLGTITTAATPVIYPFVVSRSLGSGAIESSQFAPSIGEYVTSVMTANPNLVGLFNGGDSFNNLGTSVYANAGQLTLTNDGSIYGSIVVNGAQLIFINNGIYVPGSTTELQGGTLTLASGSMMTPGGGGFVESSHLYGNLVEQAGSNYLVNVDLSNYTASSYIVSGTASVAGNVDLNLMSTQAAKPGDYTATILTAQGGVTNNGLVLAPPDTAVATYALAFGKDDVQLDYDINYAPAAGDVLTSNSRAFGNYLGRIQTAGGTPQLASLMSTVFATPTVSQLQGLYGQLTPGGAVALSSSALQSNLEFSDEILRCHQDGATFAGSGSCNWGSFDTGNSTQNASFSSVGYAASNSGFSSGFEHAIGNGSTSFGAAIRYNNGSLDDTGGAWSYSGGGLEAGVSATRIVSNGTLLSADLIGGAGSYTTNRSVGYPSSETSANGKQALSYVGAHVRAERHGGSRRFGFTPYVDLGMTQVNAGALNETGAGALDVAVAAHHELFPTISTGVRLESEHLGTTSLHAALDLSVTQLLGGAQSSTTATLAGAPATVAPFALSNTMDRTYFRVAPSLLLSRTTKLSIRLGGTYDFSAGSHASGLYLQFGTKL